MPVASIRMTRHTINTGRLILKDAILISRPPLKRFHSRQLYQADLLMRLHNFWISLIKFSFKLFKEPEPGYYIKYSFFYLQNTELAFRPVLLKHQDLSCHTVSFTQTVSFGISFILLKPLQFNRQNQPFFHINKFAVKFQKFCFNFQTLCFTV